MDRLAALLRPTEVLLISDEVYEHMVFDGQRHASASAHPELAARAFVVSSFGKTFHVTGWKIGTVAAPAALTAEFRKVHQFNVFTVNTPMQFALAQLPRRPGALPRAERASTSTSATCSAPAWRRRDCARCRARAPTSSASTTAQSASCDEAAFCRWLTTDIGVAAIPLSVFYDAGFEQRIVRLCFAKRDETLRLALDRLAKV